jgi:thermitase
MQSLPRKKTARTSRNVVSKIRRKAAASITLVSIMAMHSARGDELDKDGLKPARRGAAGDESMSVAVLSNDEAADLQATAPNGFVAQRVLVKFKHGTRAEDSDRVLGHVLGARAIDEVPQIGVRIIELSADAGTVAQIHALRASPHVEYAEVDRIYAPADVTPNDYWYFGQWHLTKIAAPAAWATTTGSSSVIIAICDTGVEPSHPDLSPKLIPGWNVFNSNSDTHDVSGHGTAVAGTAGAAANNAIGIASVAWGCPIMPIRVSDATGLASASTIASGILWAADHGARVVNASFYGINGDATVTSAAQYLQSKGGVLTAAGGNDGLFYDAPDNPYILAVGATGSNDVLASFSSRGNYIDLCAPGAGIYTTGLGGTYASGSGTSFAAPIVAGVAALVISAKPSLSGQQIQDILKHNADDLGTTGWDSSYGWGRVNAQRAVAAAVASSSPPDTIAPTVSFAAPANGSTVSGLVSVQTSATDNSGVASVSLYVDGGLFATASASPYSFSWNTTTSSNGSHALMAKATDLAGNSATSQISTSVSNTAVDITAPVVAITFPQNGWTVWRTMPTVSVQVNATDNSGVRRVELYVDGVIKSTSTAAPFTTAWNSRSTPSGIHGLQCRAYDAAGNMGMSQTIVVYN